MKINTTIIQKPHSINRYLIPSSAVLEKLYSSSITPLSTFKETLIINNKSNIFIKNTTFNNKIKTDDENNISILNVNQSTLDGKQITLEGNLSTTFVANYNCSQATVKCDQLSTISLINSRNDKQSFFNFPAPADVYDYTIYPMLISNGQRTDWCERKYGWTDLPFIPALSGDLNGIDINITPTAIKYEDGGWFYQLSGLYNGSVTINYKEGTYFPGHVVIRDCTAKITLNGFNFRKLIVKNCRALYLNDCSFDIYNISEDLDKLKDDKNFNIEEMLGHDWNPLKQKQGDFDYVFKNADGSENTSQNYCISASNSNIYLQNQYKDLAFSNFFVGVFAYNNCHIYMNKKRNAKIVINQNCSYYDSVDGVRPILFLACNGSTINCLHNTLSANIIYPPAENFNGYRPSEGSASFKITNEQYYNSNNKNYTRAKSLIIALKEQLNNSQVNFTWNETQNAKSPSNIAVPNFGLYQIAKPKTNTTPNNGITILANTNKMNIYKKSKNIEADQGYFTNYNNLTYNPQQPHLAHFANSNLSSSVEMATVSLSGAYNIANTTINNYQNNYTLKKGDNN